MAFLYDYNTRKKARHTLHYLEEKCRGRATGDRLHQHVERGLNERKLLWPYVPLWDEEDKKKKATLISTAPPSSHYHNYYNAYYYYIY